jgi:hypothetical protein
MILKATTLPTACQAAPMGQAPAHSLPLEAVARCSECCLQSKALRLRQSDFPKVTVWQGQVPELQARSEGPEVHHIFPLDKAGSEDGWGKGEEKRLFPGADLCQM